MSVQEDRRFFIGQYIRTAPLNVLSILLKVVNASGWAYFNNAQFLGFFSMASTPSSICQRAMVTGELAQAMLPNSKSKAEDQAIIRTALITDIVVIGIVSILSFLFFIVTRADIVHNLGFAAFFFVLLLSPAEAVVSGAVHTCYAKRHYGWNFALNNIRPLTILAFLATLLILGHPDPKLGIAVWIGSVVAALFLSFFYFSRLRIHFREPGEKVMDASFLATVRRNMVGLVSYRVSTLLWGALPAFIVSYMHDAHEVGWFSFGMTLTGFMYSAITPINEQIYSPTISRLVGENAHVLLMRRLLQMTAVTIPLVLFCSLFVFFGGRPLLQLFGKLAFLDSFRLLPSLLAYQSIIILSSGFSYALFCMHRFKWLSVVYALSFVGGVLWYTLVHSNIVASLWCLPVSAAISAFLSFVCVWILVRRGEPLLLISQPASAV